MATALLVLFSVLLGLLLKATLDRYLIGGPGWQARRNEAARVAADHRNGVPDRWAALEAAHASECLAALTTADIDWLTWWGWKPPAAVAERRARMDTLAAREQAIRREAEASRAHTISTGGPNPRVISPGGFLTNTYRDAFLGTRRIDGTLHRVYQRPDGSVVEVR